MYLIIIAFTHARISEIALLDKQSINSVTVQIVYFVQNQTFVDVGLHASYDFANKYSSHSVQ